MNDEDMLSITPEERENIDRFRGWIRRNEKILILIGIILLCAAVLILNKELHECQEIANYWYNYSRAIPTPLII